MTDKTQASRDGLQKYGRPTVPGFLPATQKQRLCLCDLRTGATGGKGPGPGTLDRLENRFRRHGTKEPFESHLDVFPPREGVLQLKPQTGIAMVRPHRLKAHSE